MAINWDKLNAVTVSDNGEFKRRVKWRQENKSWLNKSAAIALKVITEYKRQGITKEEVAERMGISVEKMTFILKGGENLTLKTITKLEEVLGIELI